jgi:hypothetical protein
MFNESSDIVSLGALNDGWGKRVAYKGQDDAGVELGDILVEHDLFSLNGKRFVSKAGGSDTLDMTDDSGGVEPSPTYMSDGAAAGVLTEIDYVLFKTVDKQQIRAFMVLRLYSENTDHFWMIAAVESDFLRFPPGSLSPEDECDEYIPSNSWLRQEINKKTMVDVATERNGAWIRFDIDEAIKTSDI